MADFAEARSCLGHVSLERRNKSQALICGRRRAPTPAAQVSAGRRDSLASRRGQVHVAERSNSLKKGPGLHNSPTLWRQDHTPRARGVRVRPGWRLDFVYRSDPSRWTQAAFSPWPPGLSTPQRTSFGELKYKMPLFSENLFIFLIPDPPVPGFKIRASFSPLSHFLQFQPVIPSL